MSLPSFWPFSIVHYSQSKAYQSQSLYGTPVFSTTLTALFPCVRCFICTLLHWIVLVTFIQSQESGVLKKSQKVSGPSGTTSMLRRSSILWDCNIQRPPFQKEIHWTNVGYANFQTWQRQCFRGGLTSVPEYLDTTQKDFKDTCYTQNKKRVI